MTGQDDITDAVEDNLILHSQSGSSAKPREYCVAAAIKQATVNQPGNCSEQQSCWLDVQSSENCV